MGLDGAPLPRLLTWATRLVDPKTNNFKETVSEISSKYDPGPVQSFQRKVAGSESGVLSSSTCLCDCLTSSLTGDALTRSIQVISVSLSVCQYLLFSISASPFLCVSSQAEQGGCVLASCYSSLVISSHDLLLTGELLEWSLAYNHHTWPLPGQGLIPFLIDWEPQSLKRVNDSAAAAGTCHFVRFEAQHPDPKHVQDVLECLGGVRELAIIKQADEGRLFCWLDTPNGLVKV